MWYRNHEIIRSHVVFVNSLQWHEWYVMYSTRWAVECKIECLQTIDEVNFQISITWRQFQSNLQVSDCRKWDTHSSCLGHSDCIGYRFEFRTIVQDIAILTEICHFIQNDLIDAVLVFHNPLNWLLACVVNSFLSQEINIRSVLEWLI